MYIVFPKGLYRELWHDNKWLFLLSLIAMFVGLILLPFLNFTNVLIAIIISGYILFVIIFYVYYTRKGKPFYYNPFIIAVLSTIIYFIVVISVPFMKQTRNIANGYTVKQAHSIEEAMKTEKEISEEYLRKKSCREKINNLYNFFTADPGKSLIVPERDLFPIKN